LAARLPLDADAREKNREMSRRSDLILALETSK